MAKRKARNSTNQKLHTKRLRRQGHGTSLRQKSDCPCLQALCSLSEPEDDCKRVLLVNELQQGSDNDCQYCATILEAARSFLSGGERHNLQEIWVKTGDNGLLELSLRGANPCEEHSQLGVCELFTLPAPDTKTIWPTVPIGSLQQAYTGSRTYLDYILPWVKKCAAEHPMCRQQEGSFVPKRVLDVGCPDADQVRLVETQGAHGPENYTCLSHKWGDYRPLLTSVQVLEDHVSGIPLTKLPPTFREAVEITRYLGVRYLWIDSLCIVQDDHDDWVMQSSEMARIFGNSFLTISATVSEDALDGIFKHTRRGSAHVEIGHQGNPKTSTGVHVRNVISHDFLRPLEQYAYEDRCKEWYSLFPLMGRAWAYQEYRLSPRVVLFTCDEIVWQCNEKTWCCCSPQSIKDGLKISIARGLNAGTAHATGKKNEYLSIPTCWELIVRYYSLKDITKEGDRLPALSGIARRFQSIRNGRYLAGLWEDNLVKELCWKVTVQGRRPKTYVAPSWSWCSVFGTSSRTSDSELVRVDVQVKEVECTLATSDPTGAVSSGFIRLSGLLIQGKAIIPSSNAQPSFRFRGMEFAFYADALGDDLSAIRSSNYTLYGLKIGGEERNAHRETPTIYVLILLKLKGSQDRFQRVGIAELDVHAWWDRCRTNRTIMII